MHGRKKGPSAAPTAEEEARARAFAGAYKDAMARRVAARAAGDPTRWPCAPYDALSVTQAVLREEPEVYSMWGWRREALGALLEGAAPEARAGLCADEAALVEACLMRNPKSYCAWFHRKWMASRGMVDLAAEMRLIAQMLDADERNFHCWAYRRHVATMQRAAGQGTRPDDGAALREADMAFVRRKLQQNFSNFSAWHHRAEAWVRAAPDAAAGGAPLSRSGIESGALVLSHDQLASELTFVRDAIFTEPDDQSAWLYHRWLLGIGGRRDARPAPETVLRAEEEVVRELLELEPDCRHALVTLSLIEAALGDAGAQRGALERLSQTDLLRAGAYADKLLQAGGGP